MRRVIIVLLMSLGLVAATGSAAHASAWQLTDGFDYQPASTWTLYHEGTGGGGFDLNAGTAYTPPNNAWLTAQTGWSSVGRSVYMWPVDFRYTDSCGAGIRIQPLGTARLNFEVINPSNWTYIALKTVTLTGGGYQLVTVGPWTPDRATVFIRVSLAGAGYFSAVRVDELIVQCHYY